MGYLAISLHQPRAVLVVLTGHNLRDRHNAARASLCVLPAGSVWLDSVLTLVDLDIELIGGILLCRRFPHLVRKGVWASLAVYVVALLVASFATNVATLLVFQGLIVGSAGGWMYTPVYA